MNNILRAIGPSLLVLSAIANGCSRDASDRAATFSQLLLDAQSTLVPSPEPAVAEAIAECVRSNGAPSYEQFMRSLELARTASGGSPTMLADPAFVGSWPVELGISQADRRVYAQALNIDEDAVTGGGVEEMFFMNIRNHKSLLDVYSRLSPAEQSQLEGDLSVRADAAAWWFDSSDEFLCDGIKWRGSDGAATTIRIVFKKNGEFVTFHFASDDQRTIYTFLKVLFCS